VTENQIRTSHLCR